MAVRGDIRSWEYALASRCNWGWLRGCFGPMITPSDVDFIVERRGRFLIGEIKQAREDMTQGQSILLTALSRLPRMTAFALVGHIEDHDIWPREMLNFPNGAWHPIDRQGFQDFCCAWYEVAEAAP